ncbi:hypothetical protein ACFQ61_08155 [Streptomyces sp. NPDC056500]|uniref:hypothetical protein n=1 Tax=Streptomyces sp. NPDC056500 TaxID=3345840 RepID=UPI00367487FB
MPDVLSTTLALIAYGSAGMAYLTAEHLTPTKILTETLSGADGSTLIPVFGAIAVAIGYPVLLALWPLVLAWSIGERAVRKLRELGS